MLEDITGYTCWRAARGFHAHLIEALGYRYEPGTASLEDDTLVPLAAGPRHPQARSGSRASPAEGSGVRPGTLVGFLGSLS